MSRLTDKVCLITGGARSVGLATARLFLQEGARVALADGRSIVITSSVAAIRDDPNVYAHITAKHVQIGLMRCLAKELAPRGIRVNTIHPGPLSNDIQLDIEKGLGEAIGRDGTEFFNDMIPLGQHGTAEEVARSVLYLASSQSSFTTGSMLMVDGGMSA